MKSPILGPKLNRVAISVTSIPHGLVLKVAVMPLLMVLMMVPVSGFSQTKNAATTNTKTGTSTTTEPAASQAPGPKGGMAGMSKEDQAAHHEKMAGMHTKMVECLKSSKPPQDCQQEMNQSCAAIHKGSCPMAGDSKGKGMGMAGSTSTGTSTSSTAKGAPGAAGTGKGAPKASGKAGKGGSKTGTGTGSKASKAAAPKK